MIVARRRRPRPPPHRRRDLRARAPARAARGRAGPPLRGGDPRPVARPGGNRAARAAGAQPGAADGLAAAAPAAPRAPRARPLPARDPAGLPVPGRAHDPGPLVRARPLRDGRLGAPRLPHGRPALGAPRGADPRDLGADERRPRRAVRDPPRADRRHAARRRPGLPARRRPRRLPSARRRDRAAQGPARGRGGGRAPSAVPLVVVGPARDPALERALRDGGRGPARLRAEAGARPPLPGGGAASSSRRATRGSACRCSRRWPAARRSSRGPTPRCARSPATRRCSSDGDLADAVRTALRGLRAALRGRARAGEAVHVGGDGPPARRAVYRELLP